MKKLFLLFLLFNFIDLHAGDKAKIEEILSKYALASKNLIRAEYDVQKTDTFVNSTTGRRLTGHALAERETHDSIFGFIFYGDNYTFGLQTLYDGKKGFWIERKKKTYRMLEASRGMLGAPGGQLIVPELFTPVAEYENVVLREETPKSFIIEYRFADDTEHNVLNRRKIVELDKKNYLPKLVIYSYRMLGRVGFHQAAIRNLRLNAAVTNSVGRMEKGLSQYSIQKEQESGKGRDLIGIKAPLFSLPDLSGKKPSVELSAGMPVLLDFWEPWCSPCIGSLPEVEKIAQKYAGRISVIGIVTDDSAGAKKMAKIKRLSYTNAIGNKHIKEAYGVNGVPSYFLIDKNGIVKHSYVGFTSGIEKDVEALLSRHDR